MSIELLIQNGEILFAPVVEDGIELVWERKGQAGKLAFTVVKDSATNFQEGNHVRLTVNGINLFYGFVFSKKRDKGPTISVVAYDQMRYLIKNKDIIDYSGQTASALIHRIARDYRLQCGIIEDTKFVIVDGAEDGQSLMDMILNALDATLTATKKLFVLYDDFGKLTLKNVGSMKLDLLIDEDAGENFDYASSIDGETYNKVNLAYVEENGGVRKRIVVQDGQHINEWGVLQYFETVNTPVGAMERADALLRLYNQKTRNLSIKSALGDVRVRAGCTIAVSLNLGDIVANHYMVVSTVKHSFTENQHLMDLTLIGGEFVA